MRHKYGFLIVILSLSMYTATNAVAQNFTVVFDSSTFSQVEPFDRSTAITATLTNTGTDTEHVLVNVNLTPQTGWFDLHGPTYIHLEPGEEAKAVILSGLNKGTYPQHTLDCEFYSDKDTLNKIVKTVQLQHFGSYAPAGPANSFEIRVTVRDASTGLRLDRARSVVWVGAHKENMQIEPSGDFRYSVMQFDSLKAISDAHEKGWLGYRLEVHCPGYESAILDPLAPEAGQTGLTVEANLKPLAAQANFIPAWYEPLQRPGVWHVIPSQDWNHLAVCLGKHPDEWDTPLDSTHVRLFTTTGTRIWNFSVNEQAWGMDIRKDGSLVVVGTDGGQIVAIGANGEEVWEHRLNPHDQIREINISNSGDFVAYEVAPFRMVDAATGNILWQFPFYDVHWRGIKFSQDNSHVAIGGGSSLVLLDVNGNFVWERNIGGIAPYLIGITSDNSKIISADKGNQLTCYDWQGNWQWRHFIPILTDADMSSDASRIAALSHNGVVRLYDGDGNLLWKRAVDENGGHNAIDMTPDGKYIAVGGAATDAPFKTMLWDVNGNLLWEHSQPGEMPNPYHPYLISTMSVIISDDATKIFAGYGDAGPGVQMFTGNVVSAVEETASDNSLIKDFALRQNYPNPFNPTTQIEYSLQKATHVLLEIYNVRGQRVAVLLNNKQPEGWHRLVWDATGYASGSYFVRLQAGKEFTAVKKVVLTK